MRAGIIYDFGVNKGGGDYVMLNITKAILELGMDATLYTSKPEGLEYASKLFDMKMPDVKIEYVRIPPLLKHPYTIAYIAKKVHSRKNDLWIFSDDAPKIMSNKKSIIYVHHSHASRIKFKNYISKKYINNLEGRILWFLHERMFPKYYPTREIPRNWFLIENSTITYYYTLRTYHKINNRHIYIVYPPTPSAKLASLYKNSNIIKENKIVTVGRFEPERKYETLIGAIKLLKEKGINVNASIIGFGYDKKYIKFLRKLINNWALQDRVHLYIDADRKIVINEMQNAKAIIHTAIREPFGIAIVEGMALACIPIVRRAPTGPWLDITLKGTHGYGFSSTQELTSKIKTVILNYNSLLRKKKIIERALYFDESNFSKRIKALLTQVLSLK